MLQRCKKRNSFVSKQFFCFNLLDQNVRSLEYKQNMLKGNCNWEIFSIIEGIKAASRDLHFMFRRGHAKHTLTEAVSLGFILYLSHAKLTSCFLACRWKQVIDLYFNYIDLPHTSLVLHSTYWACLLNNFPRQEIFLFPCSLIDSL